MGGEADNLSSEVKQESLKNQRSQVWEGPQSHLQLQSKGGRTWSLVPLQGMYRDKEEQWKVHSSLTNTNWDLMAGCSYKREGWTWWGGGTANSAFFILLRNTELGSSGLSSSTPRMVKAVPYNVRYGYTWPQKCRILCLPKKRSVNLGGPEEGEKPTLNLQLWHRDPKI